MKTLTLPARLESIPQATAFVEALLEAVDCPLPAQMRIAVALDELLSNVARHAYPHGDGTVTLAARAEAGCMTLTITDEGVPFDPLSLPAPDVSAPLAQRAVGGLGVHVVRKTMDEVRYARSDGRNSLTVVKRW